MAGEGALDDTGRKIKRVVKMIRARGMYRSTSPEDLKEGHPLKTTEERDGAYSWL